MINTRLKEINFNGRRLFYEVRSEYSEYGGTWYWTNFYQTNDKIKMVSKYWWFGPLVPRFNNKIFFKVDHDIESCSSTKTQVRKWIDDALTKAEGYKERCEEISNGGIV